MSAGSLRVEILNGPAVVVCGVGLTTEQAVEEVCAYLPVVPREEVEALRSTRDTLEALVVAFCQATGEPLPVDAICRARRQREEADQLRIERDAARKEAKALAHVLSSTAMEIANGCDRAKLVDALGAPDAVRRWIREDDAECEEAARIEAERDALAEALTSDPSKWSFGTLVHIARRLLEENYPADVFDGSSGDPGPVFVARLREALAALPEGGER